MGRLEWYSLHSLHPDGEDCANLVTEFIAADTDGDRADGLQNFDCDSNRDVSGGTVNEGQHVEPWDTFKSQMDEMEVIESLMTCDNEHWKLRYNLVHEVSSTIS